RALMTQSKSESPRYPKSHLMAASGIAAALSIFLLVIPTTQVEAKRTLVQLELTETSAQNSSESTLSEELDALISETVTISSPLELTSISESSTTAASPEVVNAGISPTPLVVESAPPQTPEWTTLTVSSGDTLSTLFQKLGLSASTLHTVINSSKEAKAFTRLRVGRSWTSGSIQMASCWGCAPSSTRLKQSISSVTARTLPSPRTYSNPKYAPAMPAAPSTARCSWQRRTPGCHII